MQGYVFRKRVARRVRLKRELAMLLAIAKAYNPDEPRDEHGEWTSGGAHIVTKPGSRSERRGRRTVQVPAQAYAVAFEQNGRPFITHWTTSLLEAQQWHSQILQNGWSTSGRPLPYDESAMRGVERLKAYDPNEPRDERGRWTSGGGGGDVKQWTKDQPMHSAAEHVAAAPANQATLVSAASDVAKETGTRFVNPGPKTKDSLDRKIGGGRAPETITDAVRGGFMVNEPGEADKVVAGLRGRFGAANIIDEGWRSTRLGYFDRTALVRFGDGQVGEVQFWHPRMYEAKENGGHQLYEQARLLSDGDPTKASLMAQSRAIYAAVSLPPSWNAVRGSGGS